MLKKLVFAVIVTAAALFIIGALSNGGINVKYAEPIGSVSRSAVNDVATGAKVSLEKTSDGAHALAKKF